MKIILSLALLAVSAPAAPPANNATSVAPAKIKKPQSCAEARQAQAARSEATSYPDSYRSAEELQREIQNYIDQLCDEPVGDFGARSTWEEIDGGDKKDKKPKPRPGTVRPPK